MGRPAFVKIGDFPDMSLMSQPTIPTRPRADRLAKAVLLALAVAVGMAVLSGAGLGEGAADGARLGGDYPAFHAAGSIAAAGDFDALYDPVRQEREQLGLGIDGYLAFAYPPHVAVAYAPLSMLGFRIGYLVHTVLMSGALLLALTILRRPVPFIADNFWPVTAAAFTFLPLFTAIGGGQNTALTVLLLAAFWRGLHDDSPVLSGVAAGLMLFRPQYGVPLVGVLILSRNVRSAGVAAAVGAATWLATVPLLGVGWVSTWVEQVLPFAERDAEVNAANSISILGFLQAVLGAESTPALLLGGLGALAVIGVVAAAWIRVDDTTLEDRMALTALGLLLMSPHTMFYDAGVLVVGAVSLFAGAGAGAGAVVDRSAAIRFAVVLWLLGLSHLAASALGATPLALVVLGTFVVLAPGAVTAPAQNKKVVLHA